MTAKTRPEQIDVHGVAHRFGCDVPGMISVPSSLTGWRFLRCPTCGAAKLTRTTDTKEN